MSALSTQAHPSWRDSRALSILGMGIALPGEPVSTDDLLARMRTNFALDVERRGRAVAKRLNIQSRYICRDLHAPIERPRLGQSNAELAANAVRCAVAQAGVKVNDLQYLIAHTASPGQLMPPNVARVAELLRFDGPFVELRQACTGFANAVIFARGLLDASQAGPIAIVGSETGSIHFDPRRVADNQSQLVNLVQMGDAAAACVVAPHQPSAATLSNLYFGQIGRERKAGFQLVQGGTDAPELEHRVLEFTHDYQSVRSAGPELFKQGLNAARLLGVEIESMNYIVPHQANGRMAELLSAGLGVDADRVFVNAQQHGNTGSAAIWLALAQLRAQMFAGERALILGAEATKHMFGGFVYTHA